MGQPTHCECQVCRQHNRLCEIMRKLPEDDQAFLETIYSNLMHAETDAVYYRMKLDGTWPTFDAAEQPTDGATAP